jgi:hypothetical protein
MNLEEILKQYDPANDAFDADVARMREAILAAKRPQSRIAPVLVVLALFVFVIGVVDSLRDSAPRPPIHQPPQQLRMTTPGGTQLVWVINDSLSM